jgi:hypothetical protein
MRRLYGKKGYAAVVICSVVIRQPRSEAAACAELLQADGVQYPPSYKKIKATVVPKCHVYARADTEKGYKRQLSLAMNKFEREDCCQLRVLNTSPGLPTDAKLSCILVLRKWATFNWQLVKRMTYANLCEGLKQENAQQYDVIFIALVESRMWITDRR